MATVTCANTSESEVWTTKFPTVNAGDILQLPANVPTGGTFTLGGATGIAYSASAATLKTALVGSGAITNAATVTGDYLQGWQITWGVNGAQSLLTGSAAGINNGLSPNQLTVNVVTDQVGTASKPAIQSVVNATGWSNQHVSNINFELKGAGPTSTLIANNHNGGGTGAGSLIIFNEVPNPSATNTVSNLTLVKGTSNGSGAIDAGCCLRFVGQDETSGWRVNVHHCRFINLDQFPIYTSTVWGCIHHNEFLKSTGVGYTYALNWGGGSNNFGDGSWADSTAYATEKMIYYEDNNIEIANSVTGWDGTRGGRVCVRHNTINMLPATVNKAVMTCHGLENRNRSIRHAEFYNNYIVRLAQDSVTNNRGGTHICFNNVVEFCTVSPSFTMQWDRGGTSSGFGCASGANPWDDNDMTGTVTFTGRGVDGVSTLFNGADNSHPKAFHHGTADAGSGLNKLVDASASFPTGGGGLAQYCVVNLTQTVPNTSSGAIQHNGALIVSNTATQINSQSGTFSSMTFAAGNEYAVWRLDHAMDMHGRAGTSSASLVGGGNTSANPPIPTSKGGLEQTTEPWFEWNNTCLSPAVAIHTNASGPARDGVHYFSTAKIATIANGCPVNYAFNSAGSTTIGAQYVGATTVTTTGDYGYTYPHPLAGGAVVAIISVPGTLNYGNVVNGSTANLVLLIQNTGGATLNVSSITYPTGFTGAFSGAIAAGASQNVTVTFSPVLNQVYTGTITVNSDAASGDNTATATGTGVAGASVTPGAPAGLVIFRE